MLTAEEGEEDPQHERLGEEELRSRERRGIHVARLALNSRAPMHAAALG